MEKKYLSHLFLASFLVLLLAITSCGNDDYYDEPEGKETTASQSSDDNDESEEGDNDNDNNNSNKPDKVLTVKQFINNDYEGNVYVTGYIVGDCTKSFKYAEFEPPFTHSQALLIADDVDEKVKDYIVAVQLESGRRRNDLNLVSHPELHQQKITLGGTKARYLYMAGLKEISYYSVK